VTETVKIGKRELDRDADLGNTVVQLALRKHYVRPAALKGVDKVPWRRLDSPIEECDPEKYIQYVEDLASTSAELANAALGQLSYSCEHQGSIGTVTGPVITYMCRLLAAGEIHVPGLRKEILRFIIDCATSGFTFWWARKVREQTVLDKPLLDVTKTKKKENPYTRIYRAIAEQLATWQAIVHDPAATMIDRRLALCLIALAPGKEADQALRELLPKYEQATQNGRDPLELAELLLFLGLHHVPGDLDLLEPYLADERPLVRFSAARTWARVADDRAGEAFDTLLSGLAGSDDLDDYDAAILTEGDAPTASAAGLANLPPAASARAVREICTALPHTNSINAVAMCGALLVIVLNGKAYDGQSPLTADQRTAIRAICDADNAWVFVNITDAFEGTGLPANRQQLRALIA